jgi:hypothetical protein
LNASTSTPHTTTLQSWLTLLEEEQQQELAAVVSAPEVTEAETVDEGAAAAEDLDEVPTRTKRRNGSQ